MAIACPIDLDTRKLREEIQSIYARVATNPSGDFHFHRGPRYAAELLNYDRAAWDELPHESTMSFAGVANPHRIDHIGEAEIVVDIGCGAGMDLLLAAKSVGPRGRAIGIDMTESMKEKALTASRFARLENIEIRLGDAMALPLDGESVDVVISNGVLNLVPDKSVAYREVFRILKPGGRFLYGDIIVATELSESARRNIDLWTG
jgi:SAM-dependent methyltransferase